MLKATVELFMSEYFLIRAVIGKYLDCGEELFKSLGKVFLIPKAELENLYALAENETAKSITTHKEFLQYQRMRKYTSLVGAESAANAEWEEVARVKGNAISIAQSQNLVPCGDAPRNVVYTSLAAAATAGTVNALRIMGILQCEGIFLSKNAAAGVKNLLKAADWNDSVGTLALLRYCKESRPFNLARLRQEVADTPFDGLYLAAAAKYGEAQEGVIEEVKLLDKAFNSGVLKSDKYEPKYARILGGRALYIKDKEKAVFTQSKELLGIIADLPLKLDGAKTQICEISAPLNTAVKREDEAAAVVRALKCSDLRESPAFRPACLCSESEYVLDMYARAIAAGCAGVHIERIDVAELGEYDFEPTPNNIFVRSVDEDGDNRFLLFFRGEISERKMDAVKSFLQGARRAKFHLNNPNVTLNLSPVLPVCFCDMQNVRLLKPYCDVINLSPVSAEELTCAIADVLAGKQRDYGVGTISLGGGAEKVLDGIDVDAAEKLIDAAVRARRERGADIVLTREILQEYLSENDSRKIGFGGSEDARLK